MARFLTWFHPFKPGMYYIKNERLCITAFLNKERGVKNTSLSGVFFDEFFDGVFGKALNTAQLSVSSENSLVQFKSVIEGQRRI